MRRATAATQINSIYTHNLRVRVSDLNYGNHVGNDRILSFVHDARMAWLSTWGLSEMDITGGTQEIRSAPISLIMTNAAIDYRSQARWQQNLRIDVGVTALSQLRFTLGYQIYNEDTHAIVANVVTDMSCFDYTEQQVEAIPESFAQRLNQALNS